MKFTNRTAIALFLLPYVVLLSSLFYLEVISYPFKSLENHVFNSFFSLSIVIPLLYFSRRIHVIVTIFVSFIITLYFVFVAYFSEFYGVFIDIGSFASIAESNYSESAEYLAKLDVESSIKALILSLVLISSSAFCINQLPKNSSLMRIITIVPFFFLVGTRLVFSHESGQSTKELVTAAFSHHFVFDTALLIKDYVVHVSYMSDEVVPAWSNVRHIDEGVNAYVVVLGESVDRKHMTLYGYERSTTPKLTDLEGITLVMDAISPAAQTRFSVPRMMMLNDETGADYDYNIIDLANMAGFETFWISNQGLIGRHDTPVTKLANRADHVNFLNQSDFSKSGFDYELERPVAEALAGSSDKKVIFLHLLGSHPEFCSRVWKPYYSNATDKPQEINCYDDSIRNTMSLLTDIMDELRKYKGKLIFTADHGFTEIGSPPYLVHGVGEYFGISALEVPLFTWDSRHKKNTVIDKTYYMRNFTFTLADFLNIKSDNIEYGLSILSDDYAPTRESSYVIRSNGDLFYFE